MSDKFLEQIAEDVVRETVDEIVEETSASETVNNADEACEILVPYCMEEDIARGDVLNREIGLLLEKEKLLTKKLSLAKDKGLHEQADRCRLLLQRVVIHRNRKKAELAEIEKRVQRAQAVEFMERFSKEVDELTAELEDGLFDLDPKPKKFDQEPLYVAEQDYKAKAKRTSFAAKLCVWIGVLGGLLGAIAYLLLSHFDKFAFNWLILSAFGGFIVLMLGLSLIFVAVSKRNARMALAIEQEIAERKAEYEAACAEYARMLEKARKISQAEYFEDIAEAYAIEKAGDTRRANMKQLQKWIPDLSDPEKLKKGAKIALPILTACVALVIASSAKKRKKKKAQSEQKSGENHILQAMDICREILNRIS